MVRQDKRLHVVLIASEPLTLEHPDLVTMPSNRNPQFAAVADGSDFDESFPLASVRKYVLSLA
jgi:hypothetical protein